MVLENSIEIAPVDHRHWAVAISVSTIAVKLVDWALQPIITLFFKRCLIHENVVEHFANL